MLPANKRELTRKKQKLAKIGGNQRTNKKSLIFKTKDFGVKQDFSFQLFSRCPPK